MVNNILLFLEIALFGRVVNHYALVICNHGPHPHPGGVPGIAVEMSGALTNVLPRQCGGNTRGLLCIDKKGSEMKNSRLRGKTASSGFTNEQSPQGRTFSGNLLDQKSKSPLFPRAGGPWLQMISTLQLAQLTRTN